MVILEYGRALEIITQEHINIKKLTSINFNGPGNAFLLQAEFIMSIDTSYTVCKKDSKCACHQTT